MMLRSPATALGAAVLLAVASLGFGLYLQHVEGLEPCPLCIVQRLAFVATGGFALIGVLFARSRIAALTFASLASLSAVCGFGVAAWHVWLIAHPPPALTCGRPFAWMLDHMPLAALIPKVFRGEADCLSIDWTMLGLSIPQWSALLFVALIALATVAQLAAARGLRASRVAA